MEKSILLNLIMVKQRLRLKWLENQKLRVRKSHFYHQRKFFSSIKFSGNILIKRMRELAFLNKGIIITFIDSSQKKEKGRKI